MKSFEVKLVDAARKKREAEGLSIRALSAIVGISFSSLARIERGEGLPDNNSCIRLIEWLGADAEEAGLGLDRVAFVHFRAMKNVTSTTVQVLLRAAECLKRDHGSDHVDAAAHSTPVSEHPVGLSKEELEEIASKFRKDLGLTQDAPLDSLKLSVDGIDVVRLTGSNCLDGKSVRYLSMDACSEWSAMSVPLSADGDRWVVLLNDCHTVERQRVTVLEEFWHILLGHKLTKVAKIAEAYGRTYDKVEEHDAYYLASASLLPKAALGVAVSESRSSAAIASQFGTSSELVDYRIKRLGLWREHTGRGVTLG
jgi:transcriptional regulator with XRE-family HTH domain/Zn-dependent peptidase ImmA (M78 family)